MRRRAFAFCVAGGAASIMLGAAGATGVTYASFSDFAAAHAEASAGTWGPPLMPTECAGMHFDKIVVLTSGPDIWDASQEGLKAKAVLVLGLGGDDVITGGVMNDCLIGGDGADTLTGGNGQDVLIGGAGNDSLTSDNAKDRLYGGDDDDTLWGGNAPDVLDGGAGTNTCYGGHAPDTYVVPCTAGGG